MTPRKASTAVAALTEATVADTIRQGLARSDSPDTIARAVIALMDDPAVGRAYSHPLRQSILRRLQTDGALSPKQSAQQLGVALPVVAYHFRELEQLGMIELLQTRPRRGALEHIYRLAGQDASTGSKDA